MEGGLIRCPHVCVCFSQSTPISVVATLIRFHPITQAPVEGHN